MYRDALVKASDFDKIEKIVAGAYILTPHIPYYEASWKLSSMPGRLFHPSYRTHFKFGAVMLRPGMNSEQVEKCFDEIINDAGVI